MLRVSCQTANFTRYWLNHDGVGTSKDYAATLSSLTDVRAIIEKRRRGIGTEIGGPRNTIDVYVEFDDPIMQAAYDLGPDDSKIT